MLSARSAKLDLIGARNMILKEFENYVYTGLGFHGRHWYLSVYFSGLKTVELN